MTSPASSLGPIAIPRTAVGSGRSISWLVEMRAATRGPHPFLVWEPFEGPRSIWTYAAFASDVRRVAAGLRRRGLRRGEPLIIHLPNGPEFLLTWFACARVGAVAVCASPDSSRDELGYMGEHCGAVAAVTHEAGSSLLAAALPGLRWVAVVGGAGSGGFSSLASDEGDSEPEEVGAGHPAWIQYTSGTESRPKAVVLTHANALWGGRVSALHESLNAGDVHLVHLPLHHINALSYSILASMWVGGTAVLTPRFSASRFWDTARRNACTWTSMTPFHVRALLNRERPSQQPFRLWGNAYGSGPEDEVFGLRTIGWYGMTETVTHMVVDEPGIPGRPFGIGRPAPEYHIKIVRDDGAPVEAGETGRILARGIPGVSLFAGYLHDEAATRRAVDDEGWLTTGDRVTLHDDGSLTFSDRDKDMLKVGGENVAASEIERVVALVPGVREVAVVAGPHPMLDEVPIAFVVAEGRSTALADAITTTCREHLSGHKVPREVRIVTDLPRSALNKVAKSELRKILAEEAGGR